MSLMLLLLTLSSITFKHSSCKSCIVNASLIAHKVGADSTMYKSTHKCTLK